MFFIDARALGADFFNERQLPNGTLNSYFFSDTEDEKSRCSHTIYKFGKWVSRFVIPLFNGVNTRPISETSGTAYNKIILPKSEGNNALHYDTPKAAGTRVFVTLGFLENGIPSGTQFTNDPSLEGEYLRYLGEQDRRKLITAPNRFAAVFDPDTVLHAALFHTIEDGNRYLYKAVLPRFIGNAPEAATFITPSSRLCLAPIFPPISPTNKV